MEKKAILILGAPRSGTSYISGLIEGMGFYFGEKEDFVDPSVHTHNPEFYELEKLNQINENIYKSIYHTEREWIGFSNFKSYEINLVIFNRYKDDMSAVILRLLKKKSLIALKDPRFCFTLLYWNKILEDFGYKVFNILATRSINAIALSNCKIAKTPISHGYRIAIWSYLNAIKLLSNFNYKILNYDELMKGNLHSLEEIALYLDIDIDINLLYEQKTDKKLQHETDANYLYGTLSRFNEKLAKGLLDTEDYDLFLEQMSSYGIDELIQRLDIKVINEIQLFIDQGNGISEESSIRLPVAGNDEVQTFTFDISSYENIANLRLDPLNDSCVIEIEKLVLVKVDESEVDLIAKISANVCSHHGKAYFFEHFDPQIYFEGLSAEELKGSESLEMVVRYAHIAKDAVHVCANQIANDKNHLVNMLEQTKKELDQTKSSLSWRITQPLRKIKQTLKGK